MSDIDDVLKDQEKISDRLESAEQEHSYLQRNTIHLKGVVDELMKAILVLIKNEGKDPTGEAMRAWEQAEKLREEVGNQ